MRKYIVISDISKYNSYQNINARLLYLHIACHMDTSTYTYVRSVRSLASDLNMTVGTVRNALRQLEMDGLVTTQVATHKCTQYATHRTAQQTTHLHIVTIKDLETPNETPNDTPNNTPNDTPNDTPSYTHKNKNNLKKEKKKKNLSSKDAKEKELNIYEVPGTGDLFGELFNLITKGE